MDERTYAAWLLDFYGPLLTARQRELLHQHLNEDFSLAEIAKMEGVTRQAVHDTVKKAQAQLTGLEASLGLVQRQLSLLESAGKALDCLTVGDPQGAMELLTEIIDKEGEPDGI